MPFNRPQQSNLFPTLRLWFGKEMEEIDVTAHLQSFEYTEVSQNAGSGSIELFDADWDYLETFFARLGANAPITFQFGFDGYLSNRIKMHLSSYKPTFQNAGVFLDVQLLDGSVIANTTVKTKSYTYDDFPHVSQIAVYIAKINGWIAVVEPTVLREGHFREPIVQSNQPDTQFLKDVLIHRAVSRETIKSNYHAFTCPVADKVELHFHSPNFCKSGESNKPVAARIYTFARDIDGEVLEFSPEDIEVVIATMGGRDADYVSFDPKKKKLDTIKQRATNKPKQSLLGGGKLSNINNGQVNKVINRPFASAEELQAYANHRCAWFSEQTFPATLKILGDPSIHPFDYVIVNVIKRNGEEHERWSGKYQVHDVTHTIAAGEFTTECKLMRETSGKGEVNVLGRKIKLKKGRKVSAEDVKKLVVQKE